MGIQSSKIERNELEAGDHIFTYRAGGTYSHHGIYTDHGMVVHFSNASLAGSGMMLSRSKTPSRPCRKVECSLPPGSGVSLTCVDCFLKGGDLHRFKYSVDPAVLRQERGGTCTTAKSDEAATVIDRASCLFRYEFGKYNLFGNNCEDFALYCKTGLLITGETAGTGRSRQVSSVLGGVVHGVAIGSQPLLSQIAPPAAIMVSVAITIASVYVSSRISDIGVRNDVVKISVDDLAKNNGWVNDRSPSNIKRYMAVVYLDLGCNGKIRRPVYSDPLSHQGTSYIDDEE